MPIRSLSLHHVRSYKLATFAFDPNVTLILGPNGSGKTSLLEAIYLVQRGSSFRGRDRDVIAHASKRSIIKLESDEGERRVQLELTDDKIKKEFSVDGKSSQRLPARYRRPVVLFEPDELRLLSSSPQRRRTFIDDILSRLYPDYATALSRFGRTLLQRNELLKQHESMSSSSWESHLFAWDVKFAELADIIMRHRREFITTSNERLTGLYSEIADTKHDISVNYSDTSHGEQYKQLLLAKLQSGRQLDALRGFTGHGPHRDDFAISLDNYPALETASRGEMRTIMLAYKLLEVALQEELAGSRPLILMDDVFSELDITREQHLMKALKGYQTVITATDLRKELKIDATVVSLT
ncbi:MAG TPA: DNA replication and repair protein RecF [Candidatus Saccharibacteria bacterium]|nr:DNA replication and repair protein RecF [Candidatus Saccharibacteria bacterium]HRK94335.1 DNA replication and repair protein RecF [Candidatus Saccharibacteria bacterium]